MPSVPFLKLPNTNAKCAQECRAPRAGPREATTVFPLLGKVRRILPTFTTFPTLHFPTFRAAIIKSITFPAHVFLMETCPFKERTQPWSQPWVERDLPSKNLSHFPTFPTEFPTFPTDLNAKILEFRAYRLWPTYAYGLTSVWRHIVICWK